MLEQHTPYVSPSLTITPSSYPAFYITVLIYLQPLHFLKCRVFQEKYPFPPLMVPLPDHWHSNEVSISLLFLSLWNLVCGITPWLVYPFPKWWPLHSYQYLVIMNGCYIWVLWVYPHSFTLVNLGLGWLFLTLLPHSPMAARLRSGSGADLSFVPEHHPELSGISAFPQQCKVFVGKRRMWRCRWILHVSPGQPRTMHTPVKPTQSPSTNFLALKLWMYWAEAHVERTCVRTGGI